MSETLARTPDLLSPALERLEAALSQVDTPLATLRREALARLEADGLPGAKHEAWRFTQLNRLRAQAYCPAEPASDDATGAIAASVSGDALVEALEGRGPRLVFVNGFLRAEVSRPGSLPAGVELRSLASLEPKRLVRALERHRDRAQLADARSGFHEVNTALFQDGAYLHVPRGVRLEEPVLIVHLTLGAPDGAVAAHPRVVVELEAGAEATLVEVHLAPDPAAGAADRPSRPRPLTNAVVEVTLDADAKLDHVQVVRPQAGGFLLTGLQAHQERDSRLRLLTVQRGGPLVRQDTHVVLDGEGAECVLRGVYLAEGGELIDNHTWVDHAQPHCRSEQVFKGVVAGRSQAVFDGQILVREDAQQTVAHQQSRSLLLSDEAVVHANPRLQILADDVRCTHGATLGQLEAESLFYLRSRGLAERQARELLTYAFLADQLEGAPAGLQDALRAIVQGGLPGMAAAPGRGAASFEEEVSS